MEENKVKRVMINSYSDEIIQIDGEYYNQSEDYAFVRLSYSVIEICPSVLEEYKKKGFTNLYDYYNEDNVDVSIENVNKLKEHKWVDFVVLIRYLTPSEITEFFSHQITIQLCGKHITTFYPLMDYVTTVDENIVTFLTYEGNSKAIFGKFGSEADALFGPQYPTKSAIFINDFRTTYEYRRPITDIEKIFLTKRYRDPAVIGTADDHCYNGKVEVLELDLHNPDMAVYAQMRAIDNCIEVEWCDE